MKSTGFKRADYIREKKLFRHVGEHCMFMFRKLPLYGDLISVGNNVFFASNVSLVTHDVTHKMLNKYDPALKLSEYIGCIEIGDNVFVGLKSIILPNVHIGSNVVIGAGSVVAKNIPDNSVAVGNPAKVICTCDEYILKHKKAIEEHPENVYWNTYRADMTEEERIKFNSDIDSKIVYMMEKEEENKP
ncbi:MAG: acyltransferase [Lachnospiraceae bacterium]|nr:acyltransferase [Lachnospiraceae bacterium]